MQINFRFIFVIAVWFITMSVFAQGVSVKGMATVQFSGSKPSAAQHEEALRLAKINAVERYFADGNAAEQRNYDLNRQKIAEKIDDYVTAYVILNEESNKSTKRLQLVIRADLNRIRLSNTLQDSSALSNTDQSQRSPLTFVFVSREQQSVQSFHKKNYVRKDTADTANSTASLKMNGVEGEDIGSSHIATNEKMEGAANVSVNTSERITTGGSDTLKSDEVIWRVARSAEVGSVITGVFSSAGYEVIEAEYLEEESRGLINLAEFRNDYSRGDDLSSTTLRNAVKGAQAVQVPFLAIGTLDVGVRDTDPATGLIRVYVTVIGKVLNVSGRFPKTISSVGPVQYAGLGPNESVARTNALQRAAENAATQLVNELNAKGVQ